MPVYIEGQSVSFSQNLSVDCSYVSSTWFRRPGLFGRTARLTVTVCDELDSFTAEFPFVVQRGFPTDIVFGSDWHVPFALLRADCRRRCVIICLF